MSSLLVYGGERSIPDFHFYKGIGSDQGISQNVSGGGCICITGPNYFDHGGHDERLTRKEINGMIEFLNKPNKANPNLTNWKYIITLWNNDDGNQIKVNLNSEIPNYMADMPNYTEDFNEHIVSNPADKVKSSARRFIYKTIKLNDPTWYA